MKFIRSVLRGMGAAGRAAVALIGIFGIVSAFANYTMTQGTGTTFGSVVVGGFHYAQQFVCDLTTPSQCAAVSSGGAVSVATAATENHVGEVGGNAFSITNDMTTTAATTTTGQSIGGLQTLTSAVRVSGAVGASGTSGYIQTINVTFTDAIGAGPLDVYFLNANPSGSTCTNDVAFVLANADRDKVIGIAHVTDFTSSNTAVVAQANNQSMLYTVASATSIFACVVARSSFVIASTANASLVTRVVRN